MHLLTFEPRTEAKAEHHRVRLLRHANRLAKPRVAGNNQVRAAGVEHARAGRHSFADAA